MRDVSDDGDVTAQWTVGASYLIWGGTEQTQHKKQKVAKAAKEGMEGAASQNALRYCFFFAIFANFCHEIQTYKRWFLEQNL